jgi:hypothetical protein
MSEKTFTPANFESLRKTCQSIESLCNENEQGDLMHSQLVMLGENIKAFVENPIVKNSGIK